MGIRTTEWTLKNDHGLELLGNTEHPGGDAVACVVLVHGFKGYKDYGFVPVMARMLAERGILVHRFNLSCSGMTNDVGTFARADLFALDTWNRQVEDVRRVLDGIANEEIDGAGLGVFVCGHSRGGATALLTAGRTAGRAGSTGLSGVVTINAVDSCNRLTPAQQQSLLGQGWMTTESARTGQSLRIDASWLQEQLDDPEGHDVLGVCKAIRCPVLVMHGDRDDAVDISAGRAIAGALGVDLQVISGGNHVLNMANPAPESGGISPQLGDAVEKITSFVITNRCRTPI